MWNECWSFQLCNCSIHSSKRSNVFGDARFWLNRIKFYPIYPNLPKFFPNCLNFTQICLEKFARGCSRTLAPSPQVQLDKIVNSILQRFDQAWAGAVSIVTSSASDSLRKFSRIQKNCLWSHGHWYKFNMNQRRSSWGCSKNFWENWFYLGKIKVKVGQNWGKINVLPSQSIRSPATMTWNIVCREKFNSLK